MARGKSKEKFIEQAREKFGDSFEYVGEYIGYQKEMDIKCKKCGIFSQSPRNHLRSKGCPNCNGKKKKSFEDFYSEVKAKHGDSFTIKKEDFKGLQKDVVVHCKKHGEFTVKGYNLLRTIACKKCARESEKQKKIKSHKQFLKEAKKVHGDFYIYPEKYEGALDKINIECPIHGIFPQSPSNHIRGRGCPKCGVEKQREKTKSSLEVFIEIANKVHNFKYDYSLIKNYTNNKKKVDIICPNCMTFKQRIYAHIRGAGCPKCSNKISKPELEIGELLTENGIEYYSNDRKILGGLELDIVIPQKKIAIEYNGLMFHREGLVSGGIGGGKYKNYHLNKTEISKENGYNLIHIFEDEWINKKSLVKQKLLHILGLSKAKKIYARKCKLKKITSKEANDFLGKYHIQAGDKAGIRIGGFYNGTLVGVMTFIKSKKYGYKLNRYATHNDYRCIGLASRLLKNFIRGYSPKKIVTFADRRWTFSQENNLYTKIGFKLVDTIPPAYHYFDVNSQEIKRYNRQRFMKHKLLKKHPEFSKEMTEKEMVVALGYDRIYDCGNYKFEYTVE